MVRLEGNIWDGVITVPDAKTGEPADADIGWDIARRFNNHPERLAMLAAAGEDGIEFQAVE